MVQQHVSGLLVKVNLLSLEKHLSWCENPRTALCKPLTGGLDWRVNLANDLFRVARWFNRLDLDRFYRIQYLFIFLMFKITAKLKWQNLFNGKLEKIHPSIHCYFAEHSCCSFPYIEREWGSWTPKKPKKTQNTELS